MISTYYFIYSEIRWRCTGHYSRWSGDFEKTTQNHRGLAPGIVHHATHVSRDDGFGQLFEQAVLAGDVFGAGVALQELVDEFWVDGLCLPMPLSLSQDGIYTKNLKLPAEQCPPLCSCTRNP